MKRLLYGRMAFQPVFEKLLTVAVGGMNLGNVDLAENGECWLLEQMPKADGSPVIFDVGANTGEYALAALQACGSGTSVHCFEPSPAAFQGLVSRLGGHGSVRLNNLGLTSNEDGVGILYCNKHGGTGSSLIAKDLPDGAFAYELREEVRLTTLDAYLKKAGIDKIDLLKIDVEGLELEVLRGASAALASGRIDRIQFEFGEGSVTAGTHFRDFYALLSPEFVLGRLVRNGVRPIRRYSVMLEQYATGNYVAFARRLGMPARG
jgi:FkbM family methyltransferase